jgi:hypothetical protein
MLMKEMNTSELKNVAKMMIDRSSSRPYLKAIIDEGRRQQKSGMYTASGP